MNREILVCADWVGLGGPTLMGVLRSSIVRSKEVFAYDLNPEPEGTGLSLNVTENSNALEIDLAMEVASFFRVPEARAAEIVSEVRSAVSMWRRVATEAGLSGTEQELMRRAFEA